MLDRISFSNSATSVPLQRHAGIASEALSKSMERLSSGLRINRAADDAAGKAVAEKLKAQVKGLAQANANAQDGINLLQIADGGLNETAGILQRMRELVIQAANDTYTQADRAKIQTEIEQLKHNLTEIAQKTQFNGRTLLDGSIAGSRFGEPDGAYIVNNPTVGFPGSQGSLMRDIDVTYLGADEDLTFDMTIVDPGIPSYFGWSPYPAVAVTIAASNGFSWGEQALNEFWVGRGPVYDYTPVMTANGWGLGVYWGSNIISPTLDAGKTFTVFLDHTLSAVTIDRSLEFQVGGNAGQTMRVGLRGVSAMDLRLEGITVSGSTEADSHAKADKALRAIDSALNRVNEERSRLGAWQNRMVNSVQNTEQAGIEQATSLSSIADTDMAKESAAMTRNQVLQQASISLLSQANTIPNVALKLLDSAPKPPA